MNHRIIRWTVVVAMALVVTAHAQPRKPDAPGLVPVDPGQTFAVDEKFLESYQKLGSPRLVFAHHIVAATLGGEDTTNELAIQAGFLNRVIYYFQHRDIFTTSVRLAALQESNEAVSMALKDQYGAARLLRNEIEADIVILYVFYERIPADAAGARYTCTYGVYDLNRAQTVDTWSWDMFPDPITGGFGVPRLNAYARASAERIRERLTLHADAPPPAKYTGPGAAMHYTLRFVGVGAKEAMNVRRALDMVGNLLVRREPLVDTGGGTQAIKVDVQFTGGALQLADAVQTACMLNLEGMDIEFTKAEPGHVFFRATPAMLTTDETLLSGNPAPPEHASRASELLEALHRAYMAQGMPRIAVMVNQELHEVSDSSPLPATLPADSGVLAPPGAPTVVVQQFADSAVINNADAGNGSVEPADKRPPSHDFLDAREMADRVSGRLLKLRLDVVDPRQVRELLARDERLKSNVWKEDVLAQLVREQLGAEIMIAGAGRVVSMGATGSQEADGGRAARKVIRYTFRAYGTQAGQLLGTASVHRVIEIEDRDTGKAFEALSGEVVGRLARQLLDRWSSPNRVRVVVGNAPTMADVQVVRDMLESKLGAVEAAVVQSFVASPDDGGIGTIDVVMRGSMDDLLNAILQEPDLPLSLETVDMNRNEIRLKMK